MYIYRQAETEHFVNPLLRIVCDCENVYIYTYTYIHMCMSYVHVHVYRQGRRLVNGTPPFPPSPKYKKSRVRATKGCLKG